MINLSKISRLKRVFSLISIVFLVLACTNANAQNLRALFSSCVFNAPDNGSYLETYLLVNGSNATYASIGPNQFQAKIEVTYIIKKETSIVKFDKFEVLSPVITDSNALKPDFLDQQRILIEPGNYTFELKLKDSNAPNKTIESSSELLIKSPSEQVHFSGIELVDRFYNTTEPTAFTKSGLEVIPYLSSFFPDNKNKITFYTEIYNADKVVESDKYLVKYYIARHENNQILNKYVGYIRQDRTEVGVVLREFNIEQLKSGNYSLVIEARDIENKLLARESTFFQRSNQKADHQITDITSIDVQQTFVSPITSTDTLKEYIKSLRPIASKSEERFIDVYSQPDHDTSVQFYQKFFYAFWSSRNELNPDTEWREYAEQVNIVDKEFGTRIRKGYETDRGRVYLKYGKPNSRIEVPSEPNSYPYEIWHYFQIKNQTNGKFVFWSDDLVTNDYEVLHSTIFGEVNNPRWEMTLQKRNSSGFDLDQTDPGYTRGGRAREYYDNPR